jgi:hypothetical protein
VKHRSKYIPKMFLHALDFGKSSVFASIILLLISLIATFSMFDSTTGAYGLKLFSSDENPFKESDWASKYWNWWIGLTGPEAVPQANGCLANTTGSLVMMMETAEKRGEPIVQRCSINSSQGILIPMWIGWWDTSAETGGEKWSPTKAFTQNLSKNAREVANEGRIVSSVFVDDPEREKPVAHLEVNNKGSSGIDVGSMVNVTEWPPTGTEAPNFRLEVPNQTQKPTTFPGTWYAGSHGWWFVIKELTPGQHTVEYMTRVDPEGTSGIPLADAHIKYILDVK